MYMFFAINDSYFFSLSNYSTLLKIAKKTEYISESEFKTLNKWNTSPSSWS